MASGPQDPNPLSHPALVSLQSASPSPPESVGEEERPGGPGGSGKQRAEDKDLSGPYVSGGQAEDWGGPPTQLLRAFWSRALAMSLTLEPSIAPHCPWSTEQSEESLWGQAQL